jgi:hypothetical protein
MENISVPDWAQITLLGVGIARAGLPARALTARAGELVLPAGDALRYRGGRAPPLASPPLARAPHRLRVLRGES